MVVVQRPLYTGSEDEGILLHIKVSDSHVAGFDDIDIPICATRDGVLTGAITVTTF